MGSHQFSFLTTIKANANKQNTPHEKKRKQKQKPHFSRLKSPNPTQKVGSTTTVMLPKIPWSNYFETSWKKNFFLGGGSNQSQKAC